MELPIGCECEIGISWGECVTVHPGITQAEIVGILDKIRAKSYASFGGPVYN
jgi:hypothetical protein